MGRKGIPPRGFPRASEPGSMLFVLIMRLAASTAAQANKNTQASLAMEMIGYCQTL